MHRRRPKGIELRFARRGIRSVGTLVTRLRGGNRWERWICDRLVRLRGQGVLLRRAKPRIPPTAAAAHFPGRSVPCFQSGPCAAQHI